MASITNKTYWPITLPSGNVIKRGETFQCENADLLADAARLAAHVAGGDLELTYDPEPVEETKPETKPKKGA